MVWWRFGSCERNQVEFGHYKESGRLACARRTMISVNAFIALLSFIANNQSRDEGTKKSEPKKTYVRKLRLSITFFFFLFFFGLLRKDEKAF